MIILVLFRFVLIKKSISSIKFKENSVSFIDSKILIKMMSKACQYILLEIINLFYSKAIY